MFVKKWYNGLSDEAKRKLDLAGVIASLFFYLNIAFWITSNTKPTQFWVNVFLVNGIACFATVRFFFKRI